MQEHDTILYVQMMRSHRSEIWSREVVATRKSTDTIGFEGWGAMRQMCEKIIESLGGGGGWRAAGGRQKSRLEVP